MRVLFAADGSTEAELAADLIASVSWPQASVIRILCAADATTQIAGAPLAPAVPANIEIEERELVADSRRVVDEATRRTGQAGVDREGVVVVGRPASAIVDEAAAWRADLIVMGSRGHGAIASMLLGSVTAEVVDHAPCPVLVVRQPRLTRAVFGQDGSECATKAEAVLATSPIFDLVAIEVVTVAPFVTAWPAGLYGGNFGAYIEAAAPTVDEERPIAEASANRLRQAGRSASCSVLVGDPATELIRVADAHAADLVVLGTRGQTGLRRLLVGSVARNVMHHAHSSVLIVR